MDDATALAEIKRLASLDRISFSHHARYKRMPERNATYEDVREALLTSSSCIWQEERKTWKVGGGVDLVGDDLTVIVAIEADVVVVTIF